MGRWLSVMDDHPMVPVLKRDLHAPNIEFLQASRRGYPLDDIPETIPLYEEVAGWLRVPRAAGERYFPTYKDRRADCPVTFPPFQLKLRAKAGQPEFVKEILTYLHAKPGIIAQADTGFGKTICANAVIFRLQQRTLVTVHTEFLLEQWRERLIACGLKDRDIGTIQQDQFEWGGKYRVSIAMIQTLLARAPSYPKAFFNSFGLVVCDEVHNMGAETFRQVIPMFNAKHRLGLSATPHRKDGCEIVFRSHIGPIAVYAKRQKLKPKVKPIYTSLDLSEKERQRIQTWRYVPTLGRKMLQDDMVKMESMLIRHTTRNQRLVRILVQAFEKHRKVLLLTSRLEHLDLLKSWVEQRVRTHVGILKGGLKPEERAASYGCPLILGVYQYAKEALDIPMLDVMILATPRADVVQSVGRILRVLPDKKQPVVIDFIDDEIGLCRGLAKKRYQQYRQKGWVTKVPPRLLIDRKDRRPLWRGPRRSR